jgi:hypothetical protein
MKKEYELLFYTGPDAELMHFLLNRVETKYDRLKDANDVMRAIQLLFPDVIVNVIRNKD